MEDKIINFTEKELHTPFQWSVNDCNTLILQYLDEVYNKDVLKIAYKKYKTKKGAIGFQKKYPRTLSEVCIDEGAVKINSFKARSGDILVVCGKDFELGHICLGAKVLSVPENTQTEILPITDFGLFHYGLRI
tara:strand:+ start:79 stop:477 length:399 start_codon:yes stop_codon:yes gene_type:complete